MGPRHWPRPGIFPTWVHAIGRGPEYSLHGSAPLAEARNIPCCGGAGARAPGLAAGGGVLLPPGRAAGDPPLTPLCPAFVFPLNQ
eukprot:667672-Pyramimonas_sp.AAC.1